MKFDLEILKYLEGGEFSNNLSVNLGKSKYESVTRENQIINIIKNSDVIHVGCSDHIPLILEKIEKNKWLHKLITDNARSCLGIDIDKESIDFLINNLNYNNVVHANVVEDHIPAIFEKKWDYVVFGEIIEHLDNPVNFLKLFKEKYGNFIKGFIITVPNIYNKSNLNNMFRYNETINSDHRYWFTPYTISKIVIASGYKPETILYSNLISLSTMGLILRKVKKLLHIPIRYPFYYFNTIIITGTIN